MIFARLSSKAWRRHKANDRERILTDDELRAVWQAAEASTGPWGAFIRFLLLTATRRNETARMVWTEVVGTDWTIPGRTLQDQGGRYPAALSGRARRAGGNPPFPELPLCVHERRTLAHFRVLEKQEGVRSGLRRQGLDVA